ncbi:ABC transporter ATP-binding protein [Mycetocola lacteus]|uniref:ABC transporter ATP-binding protein n=1 Tax=Mycetocola lacteus TaxID=76637 RepID=A0A3L7ASB3_9MICO|nr:ABC-F family ATP-binding cassette domain-containing protein [Mycetocola lacteus]RLP82885.1 ABC transporter ATP-binding protein [Mycetocola lacteus]
MSQHPQPAISLFDLNLTRPDGTVTLDGLSGTIGVGRTGLIGANGSGKSTLLRLIAGELTPTRGRVVTGGAVGYLPQSLTLDTDATLADVLGIGPQLRAFRAIESGDVDPHHFDILGDRWDVEAQGARALTECGLPETDLDRRIGTVSGGEAMLVAIAGLRLARAPITLLDEPSNNLDRDARHTLYRMVETWPGTLVVVSHDTVLLDRMEQTAELFAGSLTVFGGPYSAWRAHHEQEQAAAIQAERSADLAVKKERRQRQEAETLLARRLRAGKKASEQRRGDKIVMNQRASEAQESAGKLRGNLENRVEAATEARDRAAERVRREESIHLELPDPRVARSRRIAEFELSGRTRVIQGPERVALIGGNGVGKTTLLRELLDSGIRVDPHAAGPHGSVSTGVTAPGERARLLTDRVGYLAQRLDGLTEGASALENLRQAAPETPDGEIRGILARMLLRGDAVHRPVSTLSGGERFRVSLARLLFAEPPAQLLILDEPTNNLDLASVDRLVEALSEYRGALLVVSHDDAFLARIHCDRVWELTTEGELNERGDLFADEPGDLGLPLVRED